MGYAGLHSNLERNHTKMIVIISHYRQFLKISRWFINVFFWTNKKQETFRVNTWYFFPICCKIQANNPSKNTFCQKQTAEFHGIRIETRKSFLVSFHIFHAHKKNLPRSLQYLPKKTCQGPKNWRDRDFIFTTENRSLLFTSCFALVFLSKWLLPIDISEIRTCSTNEMGRLRDLNSSWF